jgi:hypothetical protein
MSRALKFSGLRPSSTTELRAGGGIAAEAQSQHPDDLRSELRRAPSSSSDAARVTIIGPRQACKDADTNSRSQSVATPARCRRGSRRCGNSSS